METTSTSLRSTERELSDNELLLGLVQQALLSLSIAPHYLGIVDGGVSEWFTAEETLAAMPLARPLAQVALALDELVALGVAERKPITVTRRVVSRSLTDRRTSRHETFGWRLTRAALVSAIREVRV